MGGAQGRVGGRLWWWIAVLGLTGQLVWAIENMYLNLFVYDTITDDPTALATMVAVSATAATLATLLVGAWSDRLGRRREFIAAGDVMWGLTTMAFGLVGVDPALPNGVALAVVSIIALDAVMSFLGSGANDAAFQAWVTDSTTPDNRAKVDGVIQTLPLLGMLVVFGALDPLTQRGEWGLFFGLVGGLTVVVGVAAWFGIRPTRNPRPSGTYLATVVHGVRPATVRAHPRLYLALATWAVLGISFQTFLPYLIIYVQRYLKIDGYPIVLACVLVGASVVSVVTMRLLGRRDLVAAVIPLAAGFVLALATMFLTRGMVPVILVGIAMMGTFLAATAALSATVRNLTPADSAGQVQGVRMIAVVLLPMVIGPFIGAAVISGADETYLDLGVTRQVPTPWIFVAAAVVAALSVFPALALRRSPASSPVMPQDVGA